MKMGKPLSFVLFLSITCPCSSLMGGAKLLKIDRKWNTGRVSVGHLKTKISNAVFS